MNEDAKKLIKKTFNNKVDKCRKAEKYFGLTDSYQCAGFIMPDGKMIDLCYTDKDKEKAPLWQEKHEHIEIGHAYNLFTSYDELESFLHDCHAIRFRKQGTDGIIRVEARDKPTSKQTQQITEALKEGCSRFFAIGPEFREKEECIYSITEPRPLDIQKWINKCWIK